MNFLCGYLRDLTEYFGERNARKGHDNKAEHLKMIRQILLAKEPACRGGVIRRKHRAESWFFAGKIGISEWLLQFLLSNYSFDLIAVISFPAMLMRSESALSPETLNISRAFTSLKKYSVSDAGKS